MVPSLDSCLIMVDSVDNAKFVVSFRVIPLKGLTFLQMSLHVYYTASQKFEPHGKAFRHFPLAILLIDEVVTNKWILLNLAFLFTSNGLFFCFFY